MTALLQVRLLVGAALVAMLVACGGGGSAGTSISPSSTAGAAAGGVPRPDPRLTPGETFPGVTAADVCSSGWATRHRDVGVAQHRTVYAAYGLAYPQPAGAYELDHLIPLSLGGDNSDANLWPETAAGSHGWQQKDQVETRLHDLVCRGQLDLATAQHEIAADWYAAWQRYVGS